MKPNPTLSKDEAYTWFRKATDDVELGSSGIVTAFSAAWAEFEIKGALPEAWRGWVRMSLQRAKTKAKSDPGGLFISILRDGSSSDLKTAKVEKNNVQDWQEAEWEKTKKARKELAAKYKDAPKLSLAAITIAVSKGANAHALVAEWQRQGSPDQLEFDYPGWLPALETALAQGAKRKAAL